MVYVAFEIKSINLTKESLSKPSIAFKLSDLLRVYRFSITAISKFKTQV